MDHSEQLERLESRVQLLTQLLEANLPLLSRATADAEARRLLEARNKQVREQARLVGMKPKRPRGAAKAREGQR